MANREARAAHICAATLEKALDGVDSTVLDYLCDRGFITQDVRSQILEPGSILDEGEDLTRWVIHRIEEDPNRFYILLYYFRKHASKYQYVVYALEEEFARLQETEEDESDYPVVNGYYQAASPPQTAPLTVPHQTSSHQDVRNLPPSGVSIAQQEEGMELEPLGWSLVPIPPMPVPVLSPIPKPIMSTKLFEPWVPREQSEPREEPHLILGSPGLSSPLPVSLLSQQSPLNSPSSVSYGVQQSGSPLFGSPGPSSSTTAEQSGPRLGRPVASSGMSQRAAQLPRRQSNPSLGDLGRSKSAPPEPSTFVDTMDN